MKSAGIILLSLGLAAFYPIFYLNASGWGSSDGAGTERLSYRGGMIIELQGNSWSISLDGRAIQGVDAQTHQAYKYKTVREGEDFHYIIAGLPGEAYDIELSFVEYAHSLPGGRVFDVTCNGSRLPGLSALDLCARVGKERAYQTTIPSVNTRDGILDLRFKAEKGLAQVSHIRLAASGEKGLEIDTGESRHWTFIPIRFTGTPDQDVYEALLGRFGSRFVINPVPQLLAWRQSPLGTWTDDLSEFILAFRDSDGDIRCLPFTDRYPVFSSLDQELALTGISYACQDPALPFQVTLKLSSPFYPGDVKLSTAPFFYLEVEVSNPGEEEVQGQILLARPHKDYDVGREAPQPLRGSRGYKYTTRYTYGQETHVVDENNSGYFEFWEALAVDEPSRFNLHYRDITSTDWIWESPPAYPQARPFPLYTFVPRGYSGFDAPFTLPGHARETFTTVLACHSSHGVLEIQGDPGYRFLYADPSGPGLGSVDEVVDYALGPERPAIEEKTAFFDQVLSEPYLSPFSPAGRDLAACALQSFICNSWWTYNGSGAQWFSVWEGEPYMFHSSVDVEYTNAWFYLYFWPDLLEMLMREWVLFEKENGQGKYICHDMGVEHWVYGMAYPHDMPVEGNADYILLLYALWKQTGNTDFMREQFPHAKEYADFIFACDTDGDGLPDINVANTIDQGSPAVQESRNQAYLGVKALAAYRAAAEMAAAQSSPDAGFISFCEDGVRSINTTLESKLWLGDHFAVSLDPGVPAADRNAYSIYASNGLLYPLAAGLDTGLSPANLQRFRQDLSSAASATSRRYGSVHTSVNNENQWVSQNLWRDALGYLLGVPGWPEGQEDRFSRYWELERYFATSKSGGFWDVCAYNHGGQSRDGVARGAFYPQYAYDQSLGYYCRGVSVLSIIGALGRLRLDLAAGSLLYHPARAPCRIPVFACADWGADDPAERIPVLVFDASGGLQEVLNPDLLPARVQPSSP